MKDVVKPFNEYATMHYKLAYSTNKQKKVRASHYVVRYKEETLTNPMSYALCQVSLREFRMMARFTDKSLLQIKPYKG